MCRAGAGGEEAGPGGCLIGGDGRVESRSGGGGRPAPTPAEDQCTWTGGRGPPGRPPSSGCPGRPGSTRRAPPCAGGTGRAPGPAVPARWPDKDQQRQPNSRHYAIPPRLPPDQQGSGSHGCGYRSPTPAPFPLPLHR